MTKTYLVNDKEVTFSLCSAISSEFPALGRRKAVYTSRR